MTGKRNYSPRPRRLKSCCFWLQISFCYRELRHASGNILTINIKKLEPNRYLSPTQFAEMFGLEVPGAVAAVEDEAETAVDETAATAGADNGIVARSASTVAFPRLAVTADDLAGQAFVETHCGVAIFRLADGRYHVINSFAVATLEEARAAAEAVGETAEIETA